MRVELEKTIDATKTKIVGIETAQDSGWTVVDAFDVMVHLFLPDQRTHYGLENLWKDAADVSVAKLLEIKIPKPIKKKKISPVRKR
jgi:ribosome-associated protein